MQQQQQQQRQRQMKASWSGGDERADVRREGAPAEAKDGDEAVNPAAARRTLAAVRDYLFGDMALEREVQEFCRSRVDLVSLGSGEPGAEQDLRYTELHEEFAGLFERRLTEAVDQHGEVSLPAFMAHLRRVAAADSDDAKSDADEEDKALLETLIATVDFDCFMVLMRETKRGNNWTIDGMFAR